MKTDSKPWYKQFWPWFIIAIPLSSVIMGVIMITLAIDTPDTLVGENWYKDGLAINQKLDKQNKAKELGIEADISLDRKIGAIYLVVKNVDPSVSPELVLQLTHPTLSNLDKTFKLHITPQNRFYTKLNSIPDGFYYINLSVPNQGWEIVSSVNFSNRLFRTPLTPSQ